MRVGVVLGRGAGQDTSIRCEVVCGQNGLAIEVLGSVSMRSHVGREKDCRGDALEGTEACKGVHYFLNSKGQRKFCQFIQQRGRGLTPGRSSGHPSWQESCILWAWGQVQRSVLHL